MMIVLSFLARQPFILLFLVMAAGYALAKLKIAGISLGATAGTLIVGLGLSLLASAVYGIAFSLPEFASTLFFNLFMFSVGMKVGPQFLVGLHRSARSLIVLALTVPALATVLTLLLRWVAELPPGMTAGIFAGANTATPGLGAAKAAFGSGAVELPSGVTVEEAIGNLSTAFAFSYTVGMVLFVVGLKVLPRVFGRDAIREGRDLERSLGQGSAPLPGSAGALFPGALPVERRVFRLEQPDVVGRSLGELRHARPRLSIEYVTHDGHCEAGRDDIVLQSGDQLAVFGRVEELLTAAPRLGPEIVDPKLPRLNLQTADVVQRNPEIVGRKLGDLAAELGYGLFLNAFFRAGEAIPFGPDLVIARGDVLRVTGSPERIANLERHIGPVVRPSMGTDVLTLALGLCAGALLGAIVFPVGQIRISLGSVALLLVGVLLSTLRTRNPAIGGPYPEPARQLLED
ncbi:MAG TPA: TrkA C-terminal domain-containing protein, partial [Polyangiaceae bacterium]